MQTVAIIDGFSVQMGAQKGMLVASLTPLTGPKPYPVFVRASEAEGKQVLKDRLKLLVSTLIPKK